MIKKLNELSALFGPSGWEDRVREYLKQAAAPMADEIIVDKLGNLHVLKKGRRVPKQPLVLTAYMDEPGFMVKEVGREGMLRFGLMGNTDVRSILGKTVLVGDNGYRGVVGRKPIHLTTAEERKTMPKAEDLYIDIGATDHAMAAIRVAKGDCGVFAGALRNLGSSQVLGKALGRAVSCGVLLRMMERELPMDTWFLFTTGGLVGCRGAYGAAELRQPGVSIHVDICPGDEEGESLPKVNGGPVIPAMDQGTIFDDGLRRLLLRAAKDEEIPVQPWAELPLKGQGRVFREKGARTVAVSCPAKYLTAPNQAADLGDFDGICKLLMSFLAKLEEEL